MLVKIFLNIAFVFLLVFHSQCNTERTSEKTAHPLLSKNKNPLIGFFGWSNNSRPMINVHKGGPSPGYPENCIATFSKNISEFAPIIECDVAMTKDSVFVLMHDNTLDRTTNGKGELSAFNYREIQTLRLIDNLQDQTSYRIPSLEETLYWAKNRAILNLHLNENVPLKKVLSLINDLNAQPFVIFGNLGLNEAKVIYQFDKEVMFATALHDKEDFLQLAKSGMPFKNFIAIVNQENFDAHLNVLLHQHFIYCLYEMDNKLDQLAAVKGYSVYTHLLENGVDIISTERPFEVARAIHEYKKSKKGNFVIEEASFSSFSQE